MIDYHLLSYKGLDKVSEFFFLTCFSGNENETYVWLPFGFKDLKVTGMIKMCIIRE